MNLNTRLETSPILKLTGLTTRMSIADNKTKELWQEFMPAIIEHHKIKRLDLYSIEIYPPDYFEEFNPNLQFNKWVAALAKDFADSPAHFEKITIPKGVYMVFTHYGPESKGHETYSYIFQTWFPSSLYEVDDRPHFAIMGQKYSRNSPTSEEEIWIPIRMKNKHSH